MRCSAHTMPSADFCRSIASPLDVASAARSFFFPLASQFGRSPRVMRIPFTLMTVASTSTLSGSVSGFDDIGPSYPACPPHALPVRRSSALPAASFRFHLAMDTLAVRLAVPLIGPAEVSHLLGLRPAGRTKKRGKSFLTSPFWLSV